MNSQSAALKCENCGQAVLRSDIECWHCGAPLTNLGVDPTSLDAERDGEETAAGGPLLQILFYAMMTAVTALALFLVIRSLGQQPRLAAGLATGDALLMELIAPDGSFSVEAPADLVWYFPQAERGQGSGAAQMVGDPQFEAALQPLFGLASDAEILLIAQVESGVLAVARSERLGQLSVENVVGSLAEEPFPGGTVLAAQEGGSRAGTALAEITVERRDPPLMCRQYFLPVSGGAYLAAICSNPEQFEKLSAEFDAILATLAVR